MSNFIKLFFLVPSNKMWLLFSNQILYVYFELLLIFHSGHAELLPCHLLLLHYLIFVLLSLASIQNVFFFYALFWEASLNYSELVINIPKGIKKKQIFLWGKTKHFYWENFQNIHECQYSESSDIFPHTNEVFKEGKICLSKI